MYALDRPTASTKSATVRSYVLNHHLWAATKTRPCSPPARLTVTSVVPMPTELESGKGAADVET